MALTSCATIAVVAHLVVAVLLSTGVAVAADHERPCATQLPATSKYRATRSSPCTDPATQQQPSLGARLANESRPDPHASCVSCPSDWTAACGLCYKVINDTAASYADQRLACTNTGVAGAQLASALSRAEMEAIGEAVRSAGMGMAWLGGHAANISEAFAWEDGSTLAYTQWLHAFEEAPASLPAAGYGIAFNATIDMWVRVVGSAKFGAVCKAPLPGYASSPAVASDYAPDATQCPDLCPDGWAHSCGLCYKVLLQYRDWDDQEAACLATGVPGAHLASLHSYSESLVLLKLSSIFGRLERPHRTGMWLGGYQPHPDTAVTADSGWEWVDGSGFSYVHWANGEPNDWHGWGALGESYLEANQLNLAYNDNHKTISFPAICKAPTLGSLDLAATSATHAPPALYLPDDAKCTLCKSTHYYDCGLCYHHITAKRSWPDMVDSCRASPAADMQGSELTSVHSEAEQQELTAGFWADTPGAVWIGGVQGPPSTAGLDDGQWCWVDGSPFQYTNWAVGEPNNAGAEGEDHIHLNQDRGWNDNGYTARFQGICKAPPLGMGEVFREHGVGAEYLPADHLCDLSVNNPTPGLCDSGWRYFCGYCYRAESSERTWDKQVEACRSTPGAELASVHTEHELAFVRDLAGRNVFWLGAHQRVGRRWVWVDGSPFAFYKWEHSSSSWGLDKALRTNDRQMVPEDDDESLPAVCKKPSSTANEPHTFQPQGLASTCGQPATGCPAGWTLACNRCYRVQEDSSTTNSFHSHRKECRIVGGAPVSATVARAHNGSVPELASVQCEHEHDLLVSLLKAVTGHAWAWLGATGRSTEGGDAEWYWLDGTEWDDFDAWSAGEAAASSGQALTMAVGTDSSGKWQARGKEDSGGAAVCATCLDAGHSLSTCTRPLHCQANCPAIGIGRRLLGLWIGLSAYTLLCCCPALLCKTPRRKRPVKLAGRAMANVEAMVRGRGGPYWVGHPAAIKVHAKYSRRRRFPATHSVAGCVDTDTDGGDWVLVLSYGHAAHAMWRLDNGRVPEVPIDYCHVSVKELGRQLGVKLRPSDVSEVRFMGLAGNNTERIHFKTSNRHVIWQLFYNRTCCNRASIWKRHTTLHGHTSRLPRGASCCMGGLLAINAWPAITSCCCGCVCWFNRAFATNQTFSGSQRRWAIKGGWGNLFEAGQHAGNEHTTTLHQIWVRFKPNVVRVEVNSGPYVAHDGKAAPQVQGQLPMVQQPSVDEETVQGMARPEDVPGELQALLLQQQPNEQECFHCQGTGLRSVAIANLYHDGVSDGKPAAALKAAQAPPPATAGAGAGAGAGAAAGSSSGAGVGPVPASAGAGAGAGAGARETVVDLAPDDAITHVQPGPRSVPPADRCWVCRGTGTTNAMLGSFKLRTASAAGEEEVDSDDEENLCQMCLADLAAFGISTECTHFYCADCIAAHLTMLLREGTAPAFCPGCVEVAPPDQTPAAGRIEGKALSFLERHGVITKELQFRFMRLQQEQETLFFKCPNASCDRLLVDSDPTFVLRGSELAVKVERCACGVGVCVQCHLLVPDAAMGSHECPEGARPDLSGELATLALMRQIGKKCPKCSCFVQKNGGCDFMMCGTTAHGKLHDAIRNGGCGHGFSWSTGKPVSTFFINLQGKRVSGDPAAMYPSEIAELKARLGIQQ